MMVMTQDSKILCIVVTRIAVDVMELEGPPWLSAYTACSICIIKQTICDASWNIPTLFHGIGFIRAHMLEELCKTLMVIRSLKNVRTLPLSLPAYEQGMDSLCSRPGDYMLVSL
jgi:hypothetical protein